MKRIQLILICLFVVLIGFSNGAPAPTQSPPSSKVVAPASDEDFSRERSGSGPAHEHEDGGDDDQDEVELTSAELKELQEYVSPKLFDFLTRMATISPELLATGEAQLTNLKQMGKDELEEIIKNGRPEEIKQFKEDLALVAKLLASYPEAKNLIHSLAAEGDKLSQSTTAKPVTTEPVKPGSSSLFEEIDPFFDEFTKVDKQLSEHPEWNRYWSYWFKTYADYMAKYG